MCSGFGLEGPTSIPPERLTDAEQLCDYVVNRTNRGDDAATILAGALEVFGEDPPADLVPMGSDS